MMPLQKKTDLMKLVELGQAREFFEHSDGGKFDITGMREFCLRTELEPVVIDILSIIDHIKDTRVYQLSRVVDLTEEQCICDPAIVVLYDTDEGQQHLYIDGSHRALRLELMGVRNQLAWFLKESEIIRPDDNAKLIADWGDELRDGKIIKRDSA